MPEVESSVEKLDLSDNIIDEIEDYAFDFFDSLTVLNLSSNHLTTIGKKVLTKSLGLHELYLDNNKLEGLKRDAFEYLTDLKKLILDGNPTLNFNKTVFPKQMISLEILSLDHCNITSLPDGIFKNLK